MMKSPVTAFRNASIQSKLIIIILTVSASILFLTAALNLAQTVIQGRQELQRSLSVNGNLLSEYCVVPLSFDDPDEAARVLARVASVPGIRLAALYDRTGSLFAEYNPNALELAGLGPSAADRHRFGKGSLTYFHRIDFQKEQIGTLALMADTRHLRDEAVRYSAVLAAIFLGLILLSYALALKMQALISRPILNLAAAARRISDQGDLSQRVSWGGQDEIGVLYDGYNRMLDQLQARLKERDEAEEAARVRQQQLLQAGKMVTLGTLVSGVAHEINNPNAYIMLNASLALRKWEDLESARIAAGGQPSPECMFLSNILANINRGSQRIDAIVKRLKDYYRKDQAAAKERIDLNGVAEKAIEILDVKIRKSTRRFRFLRAEGAVQVTGDFQEMEQVLINLIENACQALPDPECGLTVETTRDADGSVRVQVRDEGTGIPKENIDRITDPFFTTKREAGGTGLGLSLALSIINDHGGRMDFESFPGRGTTVTVKLPSA